MKITDTDKKTYFEIIISDKYKINCGIWRHKHSGFQVFCNIDESIPEGEYSLNLDGISFKYKEYMVTLKASKLFTFKKLNKNIVDWYSEEQTIILKEDKEIYDLKFKIVSYNNEKLFISYRHALENCKQVKDELICSVTKSELEVILTRNRDKNFILITYINPSSDDIICKFSLIPPSK